MSELVPNALTIREGCVLALLDQLRRGLRPDLRRLIPDGSAGRQVLVELAHAEMEFRLKAGEPARVEEYLDRYPELADEPQELAELLHLEYRLRLGREPSLNWRSYCERFPHLAAQLEKLLAAEVPPSTLSETYRPAALETGPDGLPSLPGYAVEEVLGRGGMGVVYRARHLRLNRPVALKMIRGGELLDPEQRARFLAEAQAVARLSHPGIVQVYEAGEHQGRPFFAMELAEGGSLARALAGSPLAGRQAAELVAGLASAMAAAHQAGLVHRDLKPANVLLGADGQPRITDFGLAKDLLQGPAGGAGPGLTQTGAILGTPSYMAPEQATGDSRRVGPPADVYALGAILYECLVGRPPFKGAALLETLEQVRTCEPVPPRQLNPRVPRDLETICMKCLQKDPARRYSSCGALAEDLERWLRGEPIVARPVGTPERLAKWVRRNPVVAGLLAAVVLVLVAGTAVAIHFALGEARQAEEARDKEREAVRQAAIARVALEKANTQSRQFQEVLQRLEWRMYRDHLARALVLWKEKKTPEMYSPLNACRWDFRGWEHHYLWEKAHPRRLALRINGGVSSLSFHPAGELLAAASHREIRLWSLRHPRTVRSLPGKGDRIAFGPAGRYLACWGQDSVIQVWEVEEGKVARALRGHDGKVASVAWSPDGTYLASAGEDAIVRVWDVSTGTKVQSLKGYTKGISSVSWRPDGKYLAGASEAEGARVWSFPAGKEVLHLPVSVGKEGIRLPGPGEAKPLSPSVSEDPLRAVGWSFDGKYLAGMRQNALAVYQPESHFGKAGPPAATELRPALPVGFVDLLLFLHCMAWSPQDLRVAAGGASGTLRVWSVPSRQELPIPSGHRGSVTAVAWSADGKLLASGDISGAIQVQPAPPAAVEKITVKDPSSPPLQSLTWSRDLRQAATVSWASTGKESQIEIRDGRTGRKVRGILAPGEHITSLAWSPDGTLLASGSDEAGITLFDPVSGEVRWTRQGEGSVDALAWSPDGELLASGGSDRMVHLWEASSGREQVCLRGHALKVTCLAWSADGRLLGSGGADRTVRIWKDTRQPAALTLKGPLGLETLAFSPDGARLAGGSMDGKIRLWETGSGQEVLLLEDHTAAVVGLTFSPSGRQLLSGDSSGAIQVRGSAPTGEARVLEGHQEGTTCLAWSRYGNYLANGSRDRLIRIRDAATGQDLQTLSGHGGAVTTTCFSSDGLRLASGSEDGSVKIWDVVTGQEVRTLEGHPGALTAVSWSPDGKYLVSSSRNSRAIRVWDAITWSPVETLEQHGGEVLCLAFSPDGSYLASGSGDRSVLLWEMATRRAIRALTGHQAAVTHVAWSPDGRSLASGGKGDRVTLWDADTGQKARTFPEATQGIEYLAWSPDGRYLVSGEPHRPLQLWQVPDGQEPQSLQEVNTQCLAFSPDSSQLAWADNGQIKVQDVSRLVANTAPDWLLEALPRPSAAREPSPPEKSFVSGQEK